MTDVPPPVPALEQPAEAREDEARTAAPLVIDLLKLAPATPDCGEGDPDPFHPEILVCNAQRFSPRLGREALTEVDDFGNAVPRARWKLSDKASAELNGVNQGVGGWNANGGEVRLKIGF